MKASELNGVNSLRLGDLYILCYFINIKTRNFTKTYKILLQYIKILIQSRLNKIFESNLEIFIMN